MRYQTLVHGSLAGAPPCSFIDVNLQSSRLSARALRLLRAVPAAFRRRRIPVRPVACVDSHIADLLALDKPRAGVQQRNGFETELWIFTTFG